MRKIVIAAVLTVALAAGSVFAGQCTGGDKARKGNRRAHALLRCEQPKRIGALNPTELTTI